MRIGAIDHVNGVGVDGLFQQRKRGAVYPGDLQAGETRQQASTEFVSRLWRAAPEEMTNPLVYGFAAQSQHDIRAIHTLGLRMAPPALNPHDRHSICCDHVCAIDRAANLRVFVAGHQVAHGHDADVAPSSRLRRPTRQRIYSLVEALRVYVNAKNINTGIVAHMIYDGVREFKPMIGDGPTLVNLIMGLSAIMLSTHFLEI